MKKRITHPHPVWRIIRLASGITLLILGIIGGLLPIIQGWIFAIPALLLLAPESRIVRKIVVRMRTRLHLRRRRKKLMRQAAATGTKDGEAPAPGRSQREKAG